MQVLEYKANNIKENEYGFYTYKDKQTEEKYTSMINGAKMSTLYKWVVDGEWSEGEVLSEIQRKFSLKIIANKQKFLYWRIFDLDYSTLQQGYKDTLQDAYEGKCSGEEYVKLLHKINHLQTYKIDLEPTLDYQRLDRGLDIVITKIKNGEIESCWKDFYVFDEDLKDCTAQSTQFFKKLQYISKNIYNWQNRKMLIDRLDVETWNYYSLNECRLLEYLDMELSEKIVEVYKKVDNSKKNEMIDFFKHLNGIANEEEEKLKHKKKDETLRSLSYIKDCIEEAKSKESDKVTVCLDAFFIQVLNDKIAEVEAM